MAHFAILDTNNGLLQWIGAVHEEGEAFDALFTETGITDPVDQDAALDSLRIFRLDSEDAADVQKWWDSGGHMNETPECIR